MKKILFVLPSLGIGGAEKSLIDLLNVIDYKKYEVDLLLLNSHGKLFDQINPNVRVVDGDEQSRKLLDSFSIATKYLLKKGKLWLAIKRIFATILNRIKENSVHDEWKLLKNGFPTFDNSYDIAIAYLQGISEYYVIDKVIAEKKILWMHTSFKYHSSANQFERIYIDQFSKIVCVSEAAKKDFVKQFQHKKNDTVVFYNIINSDEIRRMSKKPCEVIFNEKKFNIVSVGRLHYAKGYDIAIKAFSKFNREFPDTTLYIIGEGNQKKELENLIKREKLEKNCILVGSTLNPYSYMKNADIILQASRYEGYCIVLAEAKVLGKAILTTDFFGSKEQIINGETGKIIKCTEGSIYEGLRELYLNKELLNKFQKNLVKTVERNATAEFDAIL